MLTSKRQIRAAMLVLVLGLAATSVQGRMEQHAIKRRAIIDGHRALKRQAIGDASDVAPSQAGAGTSAAAPPGQAITSPVVADPTTSAANPLNPLTNLLPVASTTPLPSIATSELQVSTPASSATQTSVSLSSSASSSITSSSRSSVSSAANTSSDDDESVDVVNVTSTALIAASLSSAAAASASSSSAKKEDESSGLNKTSIIAIIAIASSVGLIAAVWTIFRKWKLSPSRQFEDKLTPIDWSPEMAAAHRSEDKLALTRSNSDGSGVSSMNKGGSAVGVGGRRRQNSWGSANGSATGYGQRSDMAEVPYNNGMQPAYPPTNYAYSEQGYSDQPYGQPATAARNVNPYENLQRQPTGFTNGGRYGEGYNRQNY